MKRWSGSTLGPAIGAVIASSVIVLATPEVASALPSVCTSGTGNIRTWTHTGGTTEDFSDTGKWSPQGVPGSTPGEILCVETNDTLVFDLSGSTGSVHADQIQLAGSVTLAVQSGAQLFADGSAPSIWAPGTTVAVTQGQVGGLGTIVAQGALALGSATAVATLTSRDPGLGLQPPPDTGEMLVQGHATVGNLGAAIRTGFGVTVTGGGSVTVAPGSSVTADDGTALTIQAGGLFDLAGDGGYYPGSDVSGLTKSVFTNNGTLRKSGGNGTSVVQGKYQGTGTVAVLSGTLAMPDNQRVGAAVSPGATFATGRCDSVPSCQPTTNPATDPMSLGFTVPGTNGAPAVVQLEERGATADAKQIGNEVLAHADNLVPDAAHPARLTVRYSQAEVMATPLAEVQVVHTDNAGRDALLPDCSGGTLPAGLYYCVVRPVARDTQNTYVTVLTVTTSRWHLRRDPPNENAGAPTVPQNVTVTEASPFDGSALKVAWAAPASEGAGPMSGYRVHLDGVLVQSPVGTSVLVKNPGPGNHQVEVSAVNAAGTSGRVSVPVAVKAITKPRKVAGKAGKAGGRLTAGVTWRPPAEAGGLTIRGYVVAVYRAGRKLGTYKAKAGARSLQVELPRGSYTFRVRARNLATTGPWSKPTDPVRAR